MSKKNLPFLDQLAENAHLLQTGVVLVVDPSVGSSSSMPGWAVYEAGKLVDSGTWKLSLSKSLYYRLRELQVLTRSKCAELRPDVFLIEYITKFGFQSMDSLLKGVGAIISSVSTDRVIEIPPAAWHRIEPPGYEKGDEADAIAIGYFAIQKSLGVADGVSSKKASAKKESSTDRLRALRARKTSKKAKTGTTRSLRTSRKKLARR